MQISKKGVNRVFEDVAECFEFCKCVRRVQRSKLDLFDNVATQKHSRTQKFREIFRISEHDFLGVLRKILCFETRDAFLENKTIQA